MPRLKQMPKGKGMPDPKHPTIWKDYTKKKPDDVTEETTTFIIGHLKAKFIVHTALLRSTSKLFAYKTDYLFLHTGLKLQDITLRNMEVTTFIRYTNWLYTGRIVVPGVTKHGIRNYTKLWLFADRYKIAEYADLCVTELIEYIIMESKATGGVDVPTRFILCNYLPRNSTMYKLHLRLLIFLSDINVLWAMINDMGDGTAVRDLATLIWTVLVPPRWPRYGDQGFSTYEWAKTLNPCDFHAHPKDEPYAFCKPSHHHEAM